jgi:DNA-binding transcriptional LysR family regulator
MDRLETMRAFAAVATHGSFAEAARRLRQSTSVVSRAVAELEARLDLVLLTRTTRSVRLTERGQVFLESCRRILEDVDAAERHARGETAEPRGTLTVAVPVVFGRLHVLPVVNRLLADHPALAVRLILSDRNAHLAEEGIDAAVRIGRLADSSLVATRLGAVSPVLVASPDYLARHGTPQTPADLARHHVIAFEAVDATGEWRFGEEAKPVRITPRLMVNTADAAIAAAEAGVGIARVLSYQPEAPIRAGRLVPLLTEYLCDRLPVSALYPPYRGNSPNLTAFLTAARAHFQAHPVVPLDEWVMG